MILSCLNLHLLVCAGCFVCAFSLTQTVRQHDLKAQSDRKAPVFPDTYEVAYRITLPYVAAVQSVGLSYPVHIWYDGPGQKMRMEFYQGLDVVLAVPGIMYALYPRINVTVCDAQNTTVGPTSVGEALPQPLPDLTGWEYSGETTYKSKPAHMWELSNRVEEKVQTYTFYFSDDGAPLKFDMMGRNILTGSHFDQYQVVFDLYKAGPIRNDAFSPPALCAGITPDKTSRSHALTVSRQFQSLLPGSLAGHSGANNQQLRTRLQNLQFIELWNQQQSSSGNTFKLGINKFASWSHDQFVATMLGKSSSKKTDNQALPGYLGEYRPTLRPEQLPKSVDWRGTGADGVVKDQASCGSCWAFAAVGAMQSAWFLASGQRASLSEQQLVDCSWDYENNGCSGGWNEKAISYAMFSGGVALEEDYPYRGQNDFCKAGRMNLAARFKGWVMLPSRDEHAVMEAVYKYGPLAISIDALPETFKFYSEGVYNDEACKWDADHLDHAVLLVGYGTTTEGQDYWLVKNSWSKFWGEDGYIKISRRHDCGVTTAAVMAVADATDATKSQQV